MIRPLALVFLLACSSSQNDKAPPTASAGTVEPSPTAEPENREPAKPEAPLSCDERMTALAKRLSNVEITGGMFAAPRGLEEVQSTAGLELKTRGPVITVSADQTVIFNGEMMGQGAAAESELRERTRVELRIMKDALARGHIDQLVPIYVRAHRTLPASLLVELASAVPAELAVGLVTTGPRPVRQPLPHLDHPSVVAFNAELEGTTDASVKATAVAKHMEKAIGLCAPLVRVFGDVAGADRKAELLAKGAPAAVRECDCRISDLELFEHLMVAVLEVTDPTYYWLPARSSASAKTRVPLTKSATVADLVAALANLDPAELKAPIAIVFR